MTDKWQFMNTAPKDGTHILLFIEGKIIEGFWYSDCDRWKSIRISEHGCGCCGSPNDDPIAWMPLPPAPEKINNN